MLASRSLVIALKLLGLLASLLMLLIVAYSNRTKPVHGQTPLSHITAEKERSPVEMYTLEVRTHYPISLPCSF